MTIIVEVNHRLGAFHLNAAFSSDKGVTALFGKSGSGKTSLIKIIAGLIRPDEGRVVLDDEIIADTKKRIFRPKHKRRFGYVFQEDRLFPHMTVRKNLLYGWWFAPKAERTDRFDKVVELLGIASLLERGPAGLSGGERQRVAIGRALLSSPRLLLMDEPLAALDEERKAEILPYLERVCTEMEVPIFYVSHSLAEVARLANTVVILNEGKVAACGKTSEIFSQPSLAVVAGRREAGAMVEAILHENDATTCLTTIILGVNRLYIPRVDVPSGKVVRVHIPAKDVILSLVEPTGLSALNILEGTITQFGPTVDGMVEVQVNCAGTLILSRITDFSRNRLALTTGTPVYAIIKSVALDPH